LNNELPVERHIPCLDSVRGLAALSVLLGHIAGSFEWPWIVRLFSETPYLNIPFEGKSAVTMFFVLSGFVLSFPYVQHSGRGMGVEKILCMPAFYARRLVRIWIPWAFVFLLSLIAQGTMHHIPETRPAATAWCLGFWNQNQTVDSILRQCLFSLHDAGQTLLPQDWSLGVELKGSAMIPFLIILFRKSLAGMALATLLLFVFVDTGNFYVSFALGVACAGFYRSGTWVGFYEKKSVQYGMMVSGLLLYGSRYLVEFLHGYEHGVDKWWWCLSSLGCVLILLAILRSQGFQKALNHPACLLLGRISYSLYLVQFLVILCVLPWFVRCLNAAGVTSPGWLVLPVFSVGLIVSMLLAQAIFLAVERPSVILSRRIAMIVEHRTSRSSCGS